MAINIHVARVAALSVDTMGNVVSKEDPSVTIAQHLRTSLEHRVIEDSAIPNTSGNPTVKTYLESEASDDYVMEYMDQSTIITYLRTAAGGYA